MTTPAYVPFIIANDNSPDLSFQGLELGSAKTNPNSGHPDYSGQTGQWTELTLYRTPKGKFICHRFYGTQYEGTIESNDAHVCETEQEVWDFFGHDKLAKALYAKAKMQPVTLVE